MKSFGKYYSGFHGSLGLVASKDPVDDMDFIFAVPEDAYQPCPCGCGMKWRYVYKGGEAEIEKHSKAFMKKLFLAVKNPALRVEFPSISSDRWESYEGQLNLLGDEGFLKRFYSTAPEVIAAALKG